jgi:hypothetical protein
VNDVFRDPASVLEVVLAESVSAISEAERCILIVELKALAITKQS